MYLAHKMSVVQGVADDLPLKPNQCHLFGDHVPVGTCITDVAHQDGAYQAVARRFEDQFAEGRSIGPAVD